MAPDPNSRQVLVAATISHVRRDAREWADWQLALALRVLKAEQKQRQSRKTKLQARG